MLTPDSPPLHVETSSKPNHEAILHAFGFGWPKKLYT